MSRLPPRQPLCRDWRLIHDADNKGLEEHWELGVPQEG